MIVMILIPGDANVQIIDFGQLPGFAFDLTP